MIGLRTAISMFTALPVPRRWHDGISAAASAGAALRWLPAVGAGVAAISGLLASAVLWRDRGLGLLAAVIAIAAMALLTRGLHVDGLADTADGLASRAEPARALEIMRRPDIGPFGVMAVVLVLLVDIAALTALADRGRWTPLAGLVAAAATGRLAVLMAALPGVAAARADGFGALVAGRARYLSTGVLSALVLAGGAGLAAAVHASIVGWVVGQCAALVVAWLLRAHVSRRIGGVTGDVFGALVELTTALTLVGLALAY